MSSWLLFSILAPLGWGFANVMDSVVRRHFVQDDLAATWFVGVTRIPVIIILIALFGFEMPSLGAFIGMLAASFLWMSPFIFYYKALEFEEPSRVALLSQITPIFTALLAYIGIHEVLTHQEWLAFILLFSGGLLASAKKIEGRLRMSKAFFIILISTFLWALSDVFFKKYEVDFSFFWHAFIIFSLGHVVLSFGILAHSKSRKQIFHFFGKLNSGQWLTVSLTQLVGMTASFCFSYALTLGAASLTAVLTGLQPLFAFLFGLLLMHFVPRVMKEELQIQTLILKGVSFILIVIGLILLR